MFDWIRKIFDRRCDFYDKCEFKRAGDNPCECGPTYFDGIETRSYCGKYRELAGWSKPDWNVNK
jgi:hypothetical protein